MTLALYANLGPDLTHYEVDVDNATLTRRDTITLPANVQYAWPHASRRFLYVTTSDSASGMGRPGTQHHLTALRIDPASGALSKHGESVPLPTRPIHNATDIPSENVLVAFNNPSAIRVYRINANGSAGGEVAQSGPIDAGIFAHQVRVTLDNRLAILVARGHDAADGKPEEPGALQVFEYRGGVLGRQVSIAPNGGLGFGPRHLDFHPTRPWIYVSLERQNALAMFERDGDVIAPAPRFQKAALGAPARVHQLVGTVHVHPNGGAVYVANRASEDGGENSLAVYAIDQATGEPTVIQHVDTHGIHPRTFHIDPTGRLLVVAHIMGLGSVPVRLSVFRIGGDGKLEFVRAYDIDSGARTMWWMGMVPL